MHEEVKKGDIVIFKTEDGSTSLDIRLDHETIWLSQAQMATLFDKDSDTIGLHIKNIYKTKELQEIAASEDSSVVQKEGARTVNQMVISPTSKII